MKYIRRFKTSSDYEAFKNSSEWITPNIVYINENSNLYLQQYVEPPPTPYLTIEALEDGLTASLSVNACEYCVDDDRNWKTLAAGTATESINAGHTLSFRGNLTPGYREGIGTFTISKKCNLKGNCMSMLFGDNAADNFSLSDKGYAFYYLFDGCTTIVNVSSNFLPATTLSSYCYCGMFNSCGNLTTAPELLADKLVYYCYENMFSGCIKLNYIKMLATDISGQGGLNWWVSGVASNGTFVKSPALTTLPRATSHNNCKGIPEGWNILHDKGDGNFVLVFKLQSKEYEAELEMTWEEWINSEYNTDGFIIKNGIVYYPDDTHYVGNGDYTLVSITDIISSTEDYLYLGGPGGSGN